MTSNKFFIDENPTVIIDAIADQSEEAIRKRRIRDKISPKGDLTTIITTGRKNNFFIGTFLFYLIFPFAIQGKYRTIGITWLPAISLL
jgi:hypothetical protein